MKALPWQRSQWEWLMYRLVRGRMPHALLLQGRRGLGKQALAGDLVRSLLCSRRLPEGHACGTCKSCALSAAGSHPDLARVEPEEDRKTIGVDQIRGLIETVDLKSSQGGYKVALVIPAEIMTREAANALLKTLEEPPPDTVLILVAHESSLLPATVRSRCQALTFHPARDQSAQQWLAAQLPGSDPALLLSLAHGAPLLARELGGRGALDGRVLVLDAARALARGGGDPIAAAKAWAGLGLDEVAYWSHALVADLIRLKHDPASPDCINRDLAEDLADLSRRLHLRLLFKLHDQCIEMRRVLEHKLNLNPQCLLEELALLWMGHEIAAGDGYR